MFDISRCNYFEEEEVDINEWASSWLQNLFAKELQFENLLRLWGKLSNNDSWIELLGCRGYDQYNLSVYFIQIHTSLLMILLDFIHTCV